MKKAMTFSAALLLVATQLPAEGDSVPREKGRRAAAALTDALRGRLTEAMKDGGPVAAIKVCGAEAAQIAERVSREQGVTIRRTSLRLRSRGNEPSPWERELLERWGNRAEGEPLPEEFLEPAARLEKKVWRYAKPIVVAPACLGCHGDPATIPADVKKVLASSYPADAATGYKAGDLRGIISVTIPDEPEEKK